MSSFNIDEKFNLFDEKWTPKIVAAANGQLVKIAKGEGELVWHKHEHEDELFLVFKGRLTIQMEKGDQVLNVGDMYVVPKGIMHCPKAIQDTHFMMIEPEQTAHTGECESELTVAIEHQKWI